MVVTSPPYNRWKRPWPHLGNWKQGDSAGGKSKWRNGSDGSAGVTYASYHDALPHAEYVVWQHHVLNLAWAATLTDKGAIFYNHKPRVIGAKLWLPLELNPDLPLRQIVTWARAGGLNFNPTAYVPTYEWLMIMAKPAFRLRDKSASGAGDVHILQQASELHPAPFPVELPSRVMETTGARTILDPFMGSGTTGHAAARLGRSFIGIEIDPWLLRQRLQADHGSPEAPRHVRAVACRRPSRHPHGRPIQRPGGL